MFLTSSLGGSEWSLFGHFYVQDALHADKKPSTCWEQGGVGPQASLEVFEEG